VMLIQLAVGLVIPISYHYREDNQRWSLQQLG